LGYGFLLEAIPGFINYKTAEGLALRTIDSHERLLNKWLEHIGDQEIGKITAQDVVAYLSWLRNECTPRRYNGKTHPLVARLCDRFKAILLSLCITF